MFSARPIHLFSLLGFRINIDISWFFLVIYLVLTLSTRYFPEVFPNQGRGLYIGLSIAGAFGLFASIVFHELAHAVVARRFGMSVNGITLFIFGGVAELRQEPKTPRSEFWVAIAGPIASIAIGGLCVLGDTAAEDGGAVALSGVLSFLAITNTALALFNLVPAFPLDGGRILRSILWWRTGNLRRSTRIAAGCGTVFGFALMGLGVTQILNGSGAGGTWQILIGLFVITAASQARRQTETLDDLAGVLVSDVMNRSFRIASPSLTLEAVVRDYLLRDNLKFVIVGGSNSVLGYISTKELQATPKADWPHVFANAAATPFTHDTVAAPEAFALDAIRKLKSNNLGCLTVLDGSTPVGTVSPLDIANYRSVREALALRT